MKKLIVIEGLDGSGKATQTKLLKEKLLQMGEKVKTITFPNYDSESSALVKMYLEGKISDDLNDINAFAASSFYSLDRYVSYMTDWKKNYDSEEIILADRYTTSNLTHQMVKMPQDKWDEFIDWLTDFEYNKLGLPAPLKVIYLDMLPEISQRLITERYNGDELKKDIHEKNVDYIKACRPVALYAAEKLKWNVVKCFDGLEYRSLEDINKDILNIVLS